MGSGVLCISRYGVWECCVSVGMGYGSGVWGVMRISRYGECCV